VKLADTKDKLQEARVFLHYLDEAQHEKPGSIPFRYCLSVFLNAAYGVQEYLRAEVIQAYRQQARTQGKNLSKNEPRQLYLQHRKQWISSLPEEKTTLWDSMIQKRERETHEKRVKTIPKEKAFPADFMQRFPYPSERRSAFVSHYVMQQHVAAYYPEIADTIKELGLPAGTGVWTYIQEHHLEIGGALHQTVKACKDYVELLADLIAHFEQLAP